MSYANHSALKSARLYSFNPEADGEYFAARMRWRESLSDAEVRSLAYEYKTRPAGYEDDCLSDAWAEYRYRFHERAPYKEFVGRTRGANRRTRRTSH